MLIITCPNLTFTIHSRPAVVLKSQQAALHYTANLQEADTAVNNHFVNTIISIPSNRCRVSVMYLLEAFRPF